MLTASVFPNRKLCHGKFCDTPMGIHEASVLKSLGSIKRLSLTIRTTRSNASEEAAAHEKIFHLPE